MGFNLKSFLHGLADAIEEDATAVVGALRGLGVPVPAAVVPAVELGAEIVSQVSATAPAMAPPPYVPATVVAAQATPAASPSTDEHGGAILGVEPTK